MSDTNLMFAAAIFGIGLLAVLGIKYMETLPITSTGCYNGVCATVQVSPAQLKTMCANMAKVQVIQPESPCARALGL